MWQNKQAHTDFYSIAIVYHEMKKQNENFTLHLQAQKKTLF